MPDTELVAVQDHGQFKRGDVVPDSENVPAHCVVRRTKATAESDKTAPIKADKPTS